MREEPHTLLRPAPLILRTGNRLNEGADVRDEHGFPIIIEIPHEGQIRVDAEAWASLPRSCDFKELLRCERDIPADRLVLVPERACALYWRAAGPARCGGEWVSGWIYEILQGTRSRLYQRRFWQENKNCSACFEIRF